MFLNLYIYIYGKREIWRIEEKSGRHSATKKKTRNTDKRGNSPVKARKEMSAKKNNKEKLNDDEIIINVPITGEKVINDDEKNKKNKKKMNKVLKVILIILTTILVVFVTIFARYVIKNGGNVTQAIKEMFRDAVGDQDPIFILVMGISEDISAELTDTIMLIGYNPDTNQAFVLSVPRDTFIGKDESRAGGFDKINALYQKDPQKTIEAVENLTGIKIDHYVVVKTSVLVKIVNTLGGVEFDVPVDMDYDDDSQDLHIHLKAGYQKLNGDQAEQLVRFRHNNDYTSYPASYGDNDEGRTRTQREFMKVVAQQVLSTRDIDKIKSIAKDVFDNLETNIKWDQAVAYIPFAIDLKMDELEMQQLPGTTQILNKLWFFKADKAKTEEIIDGYIQRLGLTDAEKKQFLKQKTNNDKKITMNTNNTTNTTKKNNTTTDNDDNRDLTKVNSSNTTNSNTVTKNKNTTNTTNTTKNNNTEKNNTKSNETTNTTKNDDENKEKENSSSENNKSNDSSNNGSTEVTKPSQNTGNDSSGESESGNGSKTEKDSGNNSSNENSSNTGNSNGGGEESSSSQSTSDP